MGSKRASDNVIVHTGSKLFVLLWNTKSMGRICWAEQNIEKTVELPIPNETNVANRYSGIPTAWSWFPKRVSVGWILDCKVMAENVVVGHCSSAEIEGKPRKPRDPTRGYGYDGSCVQELAYAYK
jgi:hypothetical protein